MLPVVVYMLTGNEDGYALQFFLFTKAAGIPRFYSLDLFRDFSEFSLVFVFRCPAIN